MNVLDYGRSFVAGKAPWNSVRFWVESRTRLIDERSGEWADYLQCGSCKSEDTFAERDLFYEDNYDFLPVFGPEHGVIFRRHAAVTDDYRSCLRAEQMWEGQVCHLVERPDARLLDSNAAVREAAGRWEPIVARTEIWHEETGLRAIIEFPVKTLNVCHERDLYQVDSGPVVLPDLTRRHEPPTEGFSLAFVAFNRPDFADFVIEAPVPIGPDGRGSCMVFHYSRRLSLPARNALHAIPVGSGG